MKLKTIYKIFVYAIVVVAYSVIVYKLATYNNYPLLIEQITSNISSRWHYLLLCILLMPFNLLTEAIKWQSAIAHIENISIKKAIISTLRGQVGGIATPNKLGDIPTRALSLQEGNKISGTIMGFIATWTLSLVIIVIGIFASIGYLSTYYPEILSNRYKTSIICSCIGLIFSLFIPLILRSINTDKIDSIRTKTVINSISQTTFVQLATIIVWSLVRYLIFCSQLFLMLHFFNINISIDQAIISIPTIYLLTTLTPTIVASEAATRSSYAILILSPFCTSVPTIALATSLLWALNCGFPIVLGSFVFNKAYKLS